MFHKIDQWLEVITEKMVLWISDESSVTEEQLIIRKFALQSIVNEVLKLIILAIFFGMLGELTLYVCCVVTLTSTRCFMGGMHRKTMLGCFLQSLIIFMAVIQMAKQLYIYPYHSMIYIVSLIVVWKCSPIISEARIQYSDASKMKFRAKAISSILCIACITEIVSNDIKNCVIWMLLFQSMETFVVYVIKECRERRKCA